MFMVSQEGAVVFLLIPCVSSLAGDLLEQISLVKVVLVCPCLLFPSILACRLSRKSQPLDACFILCMGPK